MGGQQLRMIPGHFERGVLVAVVRGGGTGWRVHTAYARRRRCPTLLDVSSQQAACVPKTAASLLHVPRSEVVSDRVRAGWSSLAKPGHAQATQPCCREPEMLPSLWAAKSGQGGLLQLSQVMPRLPSPAAGNQRCHPHCEQLSQGRVGFFSRARSCPGYPVM